MILLPAPSLAQDHENRTLFFLNLSKLEFDSAKEAAAIDTDSRMQFEMLQLAGILYYEGQKERSNFKLSEENSTDPDNNDLSFIRAMNAGYVSLFYDRDKGDAYKFFYKAYQLANGLENPYFIKASLLAFFRYHNFEIAQVSNSYKQQLEHFKLLKKDYIDEVWLTIYSMIYYSKKPMALGELDDQYHQLGKSLDEHEKRLPHQSPVLGHVYYEKAIQLMIQRDLNNCDRYFRRVIEHSGQYPFLKDERFSSYIKLFVLESEQKRFDQAGNYLNKARQEVNLADTLTSHYYLNLYQALNFYGPQKAYDSAFLLLKRAYFQEFQLDFRRNTLEINRLNVELETQEKENANLRLRQTGVWLVSSLVVVALFFLASYLAYNNQRIKNKVQTHESEARIGKLLKEHEQIGINAMLDGQDRERQRIANELHDNLGSLLTTLKLHFHALRDLKPDTDEHSKELSEKVNLLINESYQQTRNIAHMKNAGVSAQDGLLPAVHNFVSKVSMINSLQIDVREYGMDNRLDNTLEITAFRIIQELIANIIKHSHATTASINLTQHEGSINIMVEDNGVGFRLADVKPNAGMGLYSIQKRIESIGGSVTIESVPKNGTTVIIDLPTV
jgi:signal transduction histidine kinase